MERGWEDWSTLMKKQIKIMEKVKDKVVKTVDDGVEAAKETIDNVDKVVKTRRINSTDEEEYEEANKTKADVDTDVEESPAPIRKKKVESTEKSAEPIENPSTTHEKAKETSIIRETATGEDVYESPSIVKVSSKSGK